jgi:hypothetical protein
VHGYTTAFRWCAAIFAGGAVICGALLRRGPLVQPGSPDPWRPARLERHPPTFTG